MFKNTLVKTRNLNQAAFLTALGGQLVEVADTYPNNLFLVYTHPIVLWWESHGGFVPYRKFCNQRIRLKERGRRLAHLPEKFTGKDEGFKFGNVAMVREFNQKEKEKYAVDNNG